MPSNAQTSLLDNTSCPTVKSQKRMTVTGARIHGVYKAIFFDAGGTLIHLPQSVGHHYADVGERIGLRLDHAALDDAFAACWKETPPRPAVDGPRDDDDKGWWRELVNRVLDRVAPDVADLDRDAFFEAIYGHFAEPGVWDLYPEVNDVLEKLHGRFQLAV